MDTGTFVALRPTSGSLDLLQSLQHVLHLPTPVPRSDLHCTLIDSATSLVGYDTTIITPHTFVAQLAVITSWPWLDSWCVVLIISSSAIEEYHASLRHLYNVAPPALNYVPHVTLAYGVPEWYEPAVHISPRSAMKIYFEEEYGVPMCSAVRDMGYNQ